MKKLFLDNLPELSKEFRKEAGYTHRLSEMPDNWGQEIGSELHKQLPFLSDYEVNVTLDKQDSGRGFAFGYADISNRTERPEMEHDQAGIPHLRIPIVAEERQVRPFSVFLDGERVMPMSEDRFRESLFNPSTFDLSNSMPRDPSLVEPLMPPQRSGVGMGGETKMASMEGAGGHFEGDSGVSDVVDMWINKLKKHNARPIPIEKEASAKTKTAFKHISKDQWNAIYKSGPIQKLVMKHGKYEHPEVTNAVYETATKHFGYHPKLYSLTDQEKMMTQQQHAAKTQQQMAKHQSSMKKTQDQMNKGMQKTSSLLKAIAPTIREKDRDAFVEKIASDTTLRAGFKRSGIAQTLVDVMDTKLASAGDRISALTEGIEPSVVTFQKLPGGSFMVKSANVNAFSGEQAAGQVVPFNEVAEAIGQSAASSMQPGQVATAVSNPIEIQDEASGEPVSVSEFGEYRVQDRDGNSMKGWVFPKVMAWDSDFTPQDVTMFSNGSNYALQEAVAGELVAKNSNPPIDIPKGEGVFWGSSDGQSVATAPITIEYGTTGANGVSKYMGSDVFGNKVSVSVSPDVKTPQMITANEFVLPKSWNFMRLNEKVTLTDKPEHIGSSKKVSREKTSAVLFYNGSYNFVGGCGLDKVASGLREDLDAVGAEFMLGLLGVDGVAAKQKVAEARRKGHVKMAGLKTVQLLSERFRDSVKTASAFLSKLPNLRRDLIKEAAAIEDQGTVDKVLALNFLNPENLATFIDYLPELEQASEQMAEMVLAGYLGQREIPLHAVERSMHNMEEVIAGLKAIQHAQD